MSLPLHSQQCEHSGVRWPGRPIPDHSTRCPDCGVRVARSGGRVYTVAELNEIGRCQTLADNARRTAEWLRGQDHEDLAAGIEAVADRFMAAALGTTRTPQEAPDA